MSEKKRAIITGIMGQDGYYLSELLLKKGYEVHGIVRKNETITEDKKFQNSQKMADNIYIHPLDIENYESIKDIVVNINPDEIYHLAAQHEVKNTAENFASILKTNFNSTYYFLSVIKDKKLSTKFLFAGSSRVFAGGSEVLPNEETPFFPISLYGITKAAGTNLVRLFREQEGLFACTAILFNHESPRRHPEFLTRKISQAVAEIKNGKLIELKLGNLDAVRDWGFAGDFVYAMWLMLQQDRPEDYVIGTGETHSVKDFLDSAFKFGGLDWVNYVKNDPSLTRSNEIELRANIEKAKRRLGWVPRVGFNELVQMMVTHDLDAGINKKIN